MLSETMPSPSAQDIAVHLAGDVTAMASAGGDAAPPEKGRNRGWWPQRCGLSVELWATGPSECDARTALMAEKFGVKVRYPARGGSPLPRPGARLSDQARWQWLLKPYTVLHSRFNEVLYIDADSFPTRDPSDMFEPPAYREHGALFWPDVRVTDQENPIWQVMGVPFRYESEFSVSGSSRKRACQSK